MALIEKEELETRLSELETAVNEFVDHFRGEDYPQDGPAVDLLKNPVFFNSVPTRLKATRLREMAEEIERFCAHAIQSEQATSDVINQYRFGEKTAEQAVKAINDSRGVYGGKQKA